MSPKKSPTNRDLMNEFTELKQEVTDMNIVLLRHDKDLGLINKRHELEDFAKKILDEDRRQRVEVENESLNRQAVKSKIDVNTKLVVLIGALTALTLLLFQMLKK